MTDNTEQAARALEAEQQFRTAMVDAARARGGVGADFIARGESNLWLDIAFAAFKSIATLPPADAGLVERMGEALLAIETVLQATPERGDFVDDLAQQQDQSLIDIHEISQKALKQWRDADTALSGQEGAGGGQEWTALAILKDVVSQMGGTYKRADGTVGTIEGDDGEQCWIVPHDPLWQAQNFLATLRPEPAADNGLVEAMARAMCEHDELDPDEEVRWTFGLKKRPRWQTREFRGRATAALTALRDNGHG